MSHDVSVNVSETNESILEMKKVAAIPILKDIDKLTSKATKENSNLFSKNAASLPFSLRVGSTDPYVISFQLV